MTEATAATTTTTTKPTPPTQDNTTERIEAIEIFMQQLVFLLEVEPELSADKVRAWLIKCRAQLRSHGAAPGPVLAALGNLIERVTTAGP